MIQSYPIMERKEKHSMEHKKYSQLSILKIVCGVAFAFWLMMGAPTGWIYDLGVGTGTEQGQMPDQSVSVVHTQDDVEDFFFQTIPATVPKDSLIRCPCCACGIPSMRGNTPTSTARQRGQLSFLNISP